ncbi:MAG TPA: PQQ-dependent sugar dehydrogenase [Acidimicrobiia bacterium]|nr:PQQ-dependent sugar dehydrogenase [Acidimicrobiia bacterium]
MRLTNALLALLLAACAGGEGAGTSTTSSTAAPTTSAPVTTTTPTTTAAPLTSTTTVQAPLPLDEVDLTIVQVGGSFAAPIFLTVREADDRLYVANQNGVIQSMTRDGGDVQEVVDLSGLLVYGGERGLLGLAFHPDDPGRMFVHYSRAGNGATVIAEYRLPVGSNTADPAAVRTILTHAQPAGNHNGGMIDFGPDGYLYIALGDGGGGGDTYGNGQDPHTLLGTILRVDVDGDEGYGIPPDNPFADGVGGAPEVWLWGLRNPWRFSFDGDTMWIADVGQGSWEEIDLIPPGRGGANLGWPILEGNRCFDGPQSLCDDNDFIDPVYVYDHDGGRCSVTGGYVYRGQAIPELAGAYLFADYCRGDIVAIRVEDGEVVQSREYDSNLGSLRSFGIDHDGEIYVTAGNRVYRIVGSSDR